MTDSKSRYSLRHVSAALLFALLLVSLALDPRLAIIFSPILVLALLVTHPRIESAIVEMVHGLAAGASAPRAAQRLARPGRTLPARTLFNVSSLGSRGPPLPAT